MEPQEQDILHRYYQRLSENLKPKDLLERLGILGSIRSEDVEAVLREWIFEGEDRSKQAEWLLESLRNHDQGMKYLIKGLLSSESQDFLAREILEDEFFVENDIRVLLESLKDQLNEVQILKLELLKERKKHEDTKRQLEEVKSNRTSAIFSDFDSSYSGYDSCDVTFLLKELDEEKKRREAAERRTDELVESQQQILRHFKSLEDVRFSKSLKDCLPWKAASVADLCLPERDSFHLLTGKGHVNKWPSTDSGAQIKEFSSNRNSFTEDDQSTGVLVLAQKVSTLQAQLEEEINKREEAEYEIMKLESENRNLHDELFETRDELYETRDQLLASSKLEIRDDDDVWEKDDNEPHTTCTNQLYDEFTLGRRASYPLLNQDNTFSNQNDDVRLRHGLKRMSRPVSYHGDTRVSHMWQNRNTEHYEMDQYENEIKTKPNPMDKDFRFALRRLKLDTWKLYNDLLMNGLMIKSTCSRVKRLSIR